MPDSSDFEVNGRRGSGRRREIHRLAIVNRGEAAMRCIRTVKALRGREGSDLRAVALYTSIERDAAFVRHADLAVGLAPSASEVAAYLDHDGVVEALRRAGADAVWPGWGFLAEDPDFAERLEREGIAFLGPTSSAMRALGDKIAAKALAESVSVPLGPWSGGEVENELQARAAAASLGYPLLVKAAAGGGGRGIRAVARPEDLVEALRAAGAEAVTAFGDGRVFLERRIEAGRHVEVQIAADEHGTVVALGCRDCSVQRRHQKLIEEAPPPGIPAERLRDLEENAVRLARAAGYTGLGTVEFLVAGDAVHFLEVNPRLQVEHGVTEAVAGVDLVELQIRIARGEDLSRRLARRSRPARRGRGSGLHAIEARICAEDPDAGFLPSPGRVARFDPALGPGMRLDTGVTVGGLVPAAFDSLVAKLIATGEDREEARARLAAALADFDLVIEGGATNKGLLLEVLDAPEMRAGGVDTTWLDRLIAGRPAVSALAAEGLVVAAILAYQRSRAAARLNFFADTSSISFSRVPPSRGLDVVLTHAGVTHRLEVFAVGSWRYRVHLDDRTVSVILREESANAARLEIGDRALPVLYDAGPAGVRLEIEGRPLRFGWDAAGHVRAATPAMVVAVDVHEGDRVEVGQALGLIEAMKMEIAFTAPVAGTVTEVRVRRGQQVRAGDVMIVVDAGESAPLPRRPHGRLSLGASSDPLAPLFAVTDSGMTEADLASLEAVPEPARRLSLEGIREEVRRVFLGYDADTERTELLASFLETPLAAGAGLGLRRALAEIRGEIVVFADIEQLFIAAPRASIGGPAGPSNAARLRMFVRRLRAGGAGIAAEFLDLVRTALRHYGIESLEHSDALERAALRLLATRTLAEPRHRLLLAVMRHVGALGCGGVDLGHDGALARALGRIAAMRGLVSHAVADTAAEVAHLLFEKPGIDEQAERTTAEVESWLRAAEDAPAAPPESVLRVLAVAQPPVFDRVGRWLGHSDPRRRAIALAAHLRRLYGAPAPESHESSSQAGLLHAHLTLAGEREVFAVACAPERVSAAVSWLRVAAESPRREGVPPPALELFVAVDEGGREEAVTDAVRGALAASVPPGRFTLTLVAAAGGATHVSFAPVDASATVAIDRSLHGLHPETAARIHLARLASFELERCEAPEGIHAFHARARSEPGDERIFVIAEMAALDAGGEIAASVAAFERVFAAATRVLRNLLARRDAARRLQWNRITILVRTPVVLDPETVERVARRVAPATRHLGLEKVVVALPHRDPGNRDAPPEEIEIVAADVTGANLEIQWRAPDRRPVEPRSGYERRVVEARRRRLVYPYEIVRMLTGGTATIPAGVFEEFDLDSDSADPVAVSVAGRPFGANRSAVVFGVLSTPTEKVPEGMKRVLVLSDPTMGMGALAAPECDRVVAALDLAERLGLPVEWLPVSSGARIAMDSGTENLDATARVVRRIVRFTEAGGVIHVLVYGVNVGAQSYWNALSTMLMHTRGVLIMTPGASMVLTGRAALEASGGVAAETEVGIGGYEGIMGPNGEAQYAAADLADAFRILHQHYSTSYVVPGEPGPRPRPTNDPAIRGLDGPVAGAGDWGSVAEIFDDATNPGRKRPFPMRAVMAALIDQDGGHLERWRAWSGAETAIVWDAHLGGWPVCLVGIESQNVPREGYRPLDGPASWTGGTLFPQSSKKVARALNAASGNRPVVVLANLSGFDGSPESMRKLQLEHGAEIARAVVNFEGPLLFVVVSRYHGGAYVVFSRALNPALRAAALTGSYASVIGGGPAAAVVFTREVRARAAEHPRVRALEEEFVRHPDDETRERLERARQEAVLEAQARIAEEFDAVHTVGRALAVGSLEAIVEPARLRAYVIERLRDALSAHGPGGAWDRTAGEV